MESNSFISLDDHDSFKHINQFVFAVNFKTAVDFESIVTIDVGRRFYSGTLATSHDSDDLNESIKGLIDFFKLIISFQEKERGYKFIFGVFGLDQYNFFKSIFPEHKIVDVEKFSLDIIASMTNSKDYRLVCQTEKHVLFHVTRIKMFRDLLFEWNSIGKEHPEECFMCEDESYELRMFLNVRDFIYAKGICNDDDEDTSLMIANIKSGSVTTIPDGPEGNGIKNFLKYYSEHIIYDTYNRERTFFAVLGQEQYSFFKNMFRNDYNITFIDILQVIPDKKLNHICRKSKPDVTFHARRIDLIQELSEFSTIPEVYIPETECSICLEDKPEIWTKCKHAFHLNCLSKWREEHSHCPLCRRKL